MKKTLFLATLMMLSVAVSAAPVSFPEHNFFIEMPAGWTAMDSMPPPVVADYHNIEGSKHLMVMVMSAPSVQRTFRTHRFLQDIKRALAKRGMTTDPDQWGMFQGLPSVVVVGHLPNGGTLTSLMVGAGDQLYGIQTALAPGYIFATDPEIQAALQSFKFLTPFPALPDDISLNSIGSHAFTFIVMLTLLAIAIGVLVLVVVGVIVLVRRSGVIKPKA